ncbi:MAG: sugar phosphate isomerase/epimerase family protein [Candidatus Methanomethyliaceae archaeon]
MRVKGIGINVHPDHIGGELENLERDLEFFQEVGYDYAEIPVDAVDVIYRGKLLAEPLNACKSVLRAFKLKYTVHAPLALDLRDLTNLEIQKELFRACIDFTTAIGADIFVYHYNQKTEDPQLEQFFLQTMVEMADYAKAKEVYICVENIEIDTVENVVEFVKAVAHENVKMTFDFGHAYLASKRFGFDFFTALAKAKPYIGHIHVHDNFGYFEELRLSGYHQYKLIPYRQLVALGKGDLHLPPGWGNAPLSDALRMLDNYEGVFMLEYYHHRYRAKAREILEKAKAYANLLG